MESNKFKIAATINQPQPTQNGSNSINFTDIELKCGAAVAEYHPQHISHLLKDHERCCIKWALCYFQGLTKFAISQHMMIFFKTLASKVTSDMHSFTNA